MKVRKNGERIYIDPRKMSDMWLMNATKEMVEAANERGLDLSVVLGHTAVDSTEQVIEEDAQSGRIENYYLSIENERNSAEIQNRVESYNKRIDITKILIPKILNFYKERPPKDYLWVYMEDKKCLSWPILDPSRGKEDAPYPNHLITLLPNGELISVEGESKFLKGDNGPENNTQYGLIYNWIYSGSVDLRHIKNTDEAAQCDYDGGCGYGDRQYFYGKWKDKKQLGSTTVHDLMSSALTLAAVPQIITWDIANLDRSPYGYPEELNSLHKSIVK